MSKIVWVCVNNNSHVFDTKTAEEKSYFCPKCPNYDGILIKMVVKPGEDGDTKSVNGPNGVSGAISHPHPSVNNPGSSQPAAGNSQQKPKEPVQPTPHYEESLPDSFVPAAGPVDDLGLCIMLLDCSGSMRNPAFSENPTSKMDLIAKGVSEGIFSLAGNPLNDYAYVLIMGFDHEIDILIPYTNIKQLVEEYGDHAGFQRALKEKMEKKKGATDINKALEVAFKFTQEFISSKIAALGEYKPRIQSVMDDNMVSHQVPNVRVLLFTDGGQFMGDGKTTINPSPFKNLKFEDKTIDLLMGAYYGTKEDKDYSKLKGLVSRCPRHPDMDQFFLFNSPHRVANLKGLFRMASGASGFCPTCLEEANTVTRDL